MRAARPLAVAGVLTSAFLMLPAGGHATAQSGLGTLGCDASWPVYEHVAGGGLITSTPGTQLPQACGIATGLDTSETDIAVGNDGAIYFSPSGNDAAPYVTGSTTENTLGLSTDGGHTWSLIQPTVEQGTCLWNTVDPKIVVDRRTGRIFWSHATGDLRTAPTIVCGNTNWSAATAVAYARGFQVYSTDDDGHTWTTADYSTQPTGDWDQVFVGPPVTSLPAPLQPSGYPDVVYYCANQPAEIAGPGHGCYRSLDGGATFLPIGEVVDPTTASGACLALNSNRGAVDSKGTVYIPMGCTMGSYVAVSTDEGTTYAFKVISGAPTSGVQIALDAADNLYAMWIANDKVWISVSRDGGSSWSTALDATAPGAHLIAHASFGADATGHVGIDYYGSPQTSATLLDAYVTVTDDALDSSPTFFSGIANDPASPIYHDYGFSDTPRLDYTGGTFDTTGEFLGAVSKQIGTPDANGVIQTTGYVVRLVFAQPESGVPESPWVAALLLPAFLAIPLTLRRRRRSTSTVIQ